MYQETNIVLRTSKPQSQAAGVSLNNASSEKVDASDHFKENCMETVWKVDASDHFKVNYKSIKNEVKKQG